MKILIADDNQFYCRMLEGTLKEWGYEVVVANDGLDAWEVLRHKNAPKLAILDWMMPGADGLELCRRVRSLERPEPTYILLVTAKEGKENAIAGLRSGADDYITKPFDREELRARLQVGLRIVGLQSSLATRVEQLETALSAAQKLEVMGRLAGGMAHDFNNLLTVILGGCDFLLDGWQQADLLQMIREAAERGASLTRQLLAFSRKQVLVPSVVDVNALVKNLEKMLRRLITENINLATRLDPDLGCVLADAGQLEQVLMNLVLNARDAMPAGGNLLIETHRADLREPIPGTPDLVRPGAYTLLKVSDTGCGMTEDVRTRIFEPFFTTKEQGKGTGLGLATVYGIVQQSHGSIQVDSRLGQGTVFSVYLPLTRVRAQAGPWPGPQPPQQPGNREVILLVEDEDQVRNVACHILRSNNYNVLEACDGQEALEVSAGWGEPIDLMVTDVVMPRLGGRELAERLLPARPGMRVLYMSGYTDDPLVHDSVLRQGKPFLQKPFTASALAHRVRDVLDGRLGAPAAALQGEWQ